MTKSTRRVPFRRRREKKTNYAKRLMLLKSGKPRLVFRKTNRNCIVQIIKYLPAGDETVVHVTSKHLSKYGWPGKANIPSAYLCGYLAAKKGLKKGIKEAILDIGRLTPVRGVCAFAALKGAIDGGLSVPCSKDIFPSDDRIRCKHIEEFASKMSAENLKKNFSYYLTLGIDPTKIGEYFNKAKQAIDQEFNVK
ncbi:MAG: 50S ribosomal protein L18 [Candidatus Diapherotrites archaeon]